MRCFKDFRASLEITSFDGICAGAIHYYGSISFKDQDGKHQTIEVTKTLSAKEALDLSIRDKEELGLRVGYRAGDTTQRFTTWPDVVSWAGKRFNQIAKKHNLRYLSIGPFFQEGPWLISHFQNLDPAIVGKNNTYYQNVISAETEAEKEEIRKAWDSWSNKSISKLLEGK